MIGRTDIINVGYFICRIVESPDFLGFGTDSFISVSDCLTDHEPQPPLCHGWKPRGDDKDYISRFADTETYIRMSEEMNELLGYSELLCRTPWPAYEESALVADTVEYGIQVNGKVRARVSLPADLDKAAVEQAALAAEPVQPFLSGKTVRKVIVVKNIVNIVVG